MNKIAVALITLILANCQTHPMESPFSHFAKTVKQPQRLTFALKVLNYGIFGYIGWNLGILKGTHDALEAGKKENTNTTQKSALEDPVQALALDKFTRKKCRKERKAYEHKNHEKNKFTKKFVNGQIPGSDEDLAKTMELNRQLRDEAHLQFVLCQANAQKLFQSKI